MLKFIIGLLGSMLLSVAAIAQQKGAVKGILEDTTKKHSVAEATISLLNLKDSSSAGFTATDNKGNFIIKDLEIGKYKLIIAVKNLAEQTKIFDISQENLQVDLGTIIVRDVYDAGTVVITDEAPIKIKDDTIQFRADAFKTKPNANVEDLLKKLPGVEVSKDGSVKALGENVQKVYVDGKEFFGSDPKLATKNLQAEMVDKVEIFDDMSDNAKFSKIDDGSRSKAINIKLKKNKKKGLFGKAYAGVGTNERYEVGGNINYFKNDLKLSYIGQLNNINKQGFTLQDVMGLSGSGVNFGRPGGGGGRNDDGGGGGMLAGASFNSSRGGGGGIFGVGGNNSGITKSTASGLNFVNKLGRKTELSVNYFFNDANTLTQQNKITQQFFPNDSITNAYSNAFGNNGNSNHRINARLEVKIDSVTELLIIPNITFQGGNNNSTDSTSMFSAKNTVNAKVNTSNTISTGENTAIRANNQFILRRKLAKAGRTIQLGGQYNINNSDRENIYNSPFTIFNPDGTPAFSFAQNQRSDNVNIGTTWGVNTSYTEPLGRNMLLEFNANHNETKTDADRETIDNISNAVIPTLSNEFINTYTYNRVGANIRKQTKKYNYQLGMGVQFANLTSQNVDAPGTPKNSQKFINLFPTARLSLTMKKNKSIRFDYRGRTNAPSINQLQDVLDVSNPQNISTGNPSLKQEFNHNMSFNYTKFNMFTFKFIGIFANGGFTQNKIANSTSFLNGNAQNGRQITKPINVDGAYNYTVFGAFGSPIKKVKGLNVNLSSGIIFNKDINELYAQKNKTSLLVLTEIATLTYNYKDALDLSVTATLMQNNYKNNLQKESNSNFLNQTYGFDATYTFKNGFSIGSEVDFNNQGGLAKGIDRTFTLWNASIAKTIFKKKNGELKLSVYDLLNENNSIGRSTSINTIVDQRSLVLNRYFMLSFMYNFSRFGGKPSSGAGMMPKQFRRGMKDLRVN